MTKKAWNPNGTLLGNSTTATGSADIVFASITFTDDFLHNVHQRMELVRQYFKFLAQNNEHNYTPERKGITLVIHLSRTEILFDQEFSFLSIYLKEFKDDREPF